MEERPVVELLIEAVDAMPPEDRKRVLAWLLESAPRSSRALWRLRGVAGAPHELAMPEVSELLTGFAPLRGDYQTVPVRLPTEQYHRLRDWCQDKGFSMATVIRGLVGRFLDQQMPPAAHDASA